MFRIPISLFIVAALLLMICAQQSLADDVPPAKKQTADKPTIEFKTFDTKSTTRNDTKLILIVEVEGSDEKFEGEIGVGGISRGTMQAWTFETIFKVNPDWKYTLEAESPRLVIEGWTNPKTKKFHPVKEIKFKFLNVPKEGQPVVMMPPKA